jgi:AraC-like DNA-binding protein
MTRGVLLCNRLSGKSTNACSRECRSSSFSHLGDKTIRERGEHSLANHLTPDELSEELGIDRDEVIRICHEESVPIYQGRVDKYLFGLHLEPQGAMPQAAAVN